jgi:hypothetical protein
MYVLCADHQVAYQLRVLRYLVVERIFDGSDRRDTVHERANATDALCKCPGIARVAIAQDDFDTANHRAGRVGFGNLVPIHLRLDPQMTLDSGNRIYNDSFIHFLSAFDIHYLSKVSIGYYAS